MDNRKTIKNTEFSEERALYALQCCLLENVGFEGPEDGESALKEAKDIEAVKCRFKLRYPMWHVEGLKLSGSVIEETARAALWYDKNVLIEDTKLHGIKAVRECENVSVSGCHVVSPEFGWKSKGINVKDTDITGEYAFLDSKDIKLENVTFKGKYSFQYAENLIIENSTLDTKDAFWHGKNVVVKDSVVKGEYLGWYSDGLTLINCRIIGTQPLCYAKNLKLTDCTMEGCNLAFEYSDVDAVVNGRIDSVKNPISGKISANEIGEVIFGESVYGTRAEIEIK